MLVSIWLKLDKFNCNLILNREFIDVVEFLVERNNMCIRNNTAIYYLGLNGLVSYRDNPGFCCVGGGGGGSLI